MKDRGQGGKNWLKEVSSSILQYCLAKVKQEFYTKYNRGTLLYKTYTHNNIANLN